MKLKCFGNKHIQNFHLRINENFGEKKRVKEYTQINMTHEKEENTRQILSSDVMKGTILRATCKSSSLIHECFIKD